MQERRGPGRGPGGLDDPEDPVVVDQGAGADEVRGGIGGVVPPGVGQRPAVDPTVRVGRAQPRVHACAEGVESVRQRAGGRVEKAYFDLFVGHAGDRAVLAFRVAADRRGSACGHRQCDCGTCHGDSDPLDGSALSVHLGLLPGARSEELVVPERRNC